MTPPVSPPSRSTPARSTPRPGLRPPGLPRQVADRAEIVREIVGSLRDQHATAGGGSGGGLDVTA